MFTMWYSYNSQDGAKCLLPPRRTRRDLFLWAAFHINHLISLLIILRYTVFALCGLWTNTALHGLLVFLYATQSSPTFDSEYHWAIFIKRLAHHLLDFSTATCWSLASVIWGIIALSIHLMCVTAWVLLRLERTERASEIYPVLFQARRKPAAETR